MRSQPGPRTSEAKLFPAGDENTEVTGCGFRLRREENRSYAAGVIDRSIGVVSDEAEHRRKRCEDCQDCKQVPRRFNQAYSDKSEQENSERRNSNCSQGDRACYSNQYRDGLGLGVAMGNEPNRRIAAPGFQIPGSRTAQWKPRDPASLRVT
jgi:hypothetical protein